MEKNFIRATLGKETSISDLKGVSEVFMSGVDFNEYHIAMIRSKNYAFIGDKQFTFLNNEGVAALLEHVNNGTFSKNDALVEMAIAIDSFEGKTYFNHRKFSEKIKKKHLKER